MTRVSLARARALSLSVSSTPLQGASRAHLIFYGARVMFPRVCENFVDDLGGALSLMVATQGHTMSEEVSQSFASHGHDLLCCALVSTHGMAHLGVDLLCLCVSVSPCLCVSLSLCLAVSLFHSLSLPLSLYLSHLGVDLLLQIRVMYLVLQLHLTQSPVSLDLGMAQPVDEEVARVTLIVEVALVAGHSLEAAVKERVESDIAA